MDRHAVLPSAESRKPGFFYGYIVVLAGFFIMAIMWGTISSFGVFFKPMSAEFGWTRAMTSGAYSLYMVLHGFLYIVAGRLTDRFGPRIVMTGTGFFVGLGYLLMSQVSTLWQLYLFYGVIISIGMSGGFVPLTSTVARWFIKRRGIMTGIVVSGVGVGTVIMPLAASRLISIYGWQTSYLIVGLIALVLIMLAAQFLRRDPSQTKQSPYGERGVKGESLNLEARGFSFHEAIHTRQFWMVCAIFICHGVGQQAVMVHIVPHATDLGISAIVAANILAVVGGLNIVGTVTIGSAGDRIGNKPALVIVLILVTAVLFGLAVVKGLWLFYLLAVIFGFSWGGMLTLEPPIVAELFGLRAHGAILGAVIFILTIGGAIGPLLAGHIFDITGSYYLAFLLCGVLSVISLILALMLTPVRRSV